MGNLSKKLFTAVWLFAVGLCVLSCNDEGSQFDNQKVKFTVTPSAHNGRVGDVGLPENSRARISVASSSGASVLSDFELPVVKTADGYVTDPVDLKPGTYIVTDFIIVDGNEDLYATPKKGSDVSSIASLTEEALPYQFSVLENGNITVGMRVLEVLNQDLAKFGYATSKAKGNTLPIAVYEKKSGVAVLVSATAEIRQNKKLLKAFPLTASTNTITLGGDPKTLYTLTVYTEKSAKTQTFDINKLKKELGKNTLQVMLEPALVFSIESSVDEGNEYEEYFNFSMSGEGSVNINWGDGEQSTSTLPLEISHEYISGNYTAIVTGNLSKITDFWGFSYGTIISGITGLTNLTSLKTYNPSWGAVPIKVDLRNCKKLETINIAKYGAPYEPCDLRTEFKLPKDHFINNFVFDAPSFDINREYISAAELDVMVNNIYSNAVKRNIHNGKFFVNPVVTPSTQAQQKLDILINQYSWTVAFNDAIYEEYSAKAGRSESKVDLDARRERWLRARSSNAERIIKNATYSTN